MELLERFISPKPPPTIYHYTDGAGLAGIAQNRSLWATSYLHLNDSMEHKTAHRFLNVALAKTTLSAQLQDVFTQLLKSSDKPIFVASFSEDDNLLSQWRAYCGNGQGYSIGFAPGNPLFAAADSNMFNLVKCVYSKEEQQSLADAFVSTFEKEFWEQHQILVDEQRQADPATNLRAIFRRYNWSYALSLFISSCKHESFERENEWRLISQYPEDDRIANQLRFRSGRFGLVPFFPIPLSLNGQKAMLDSITIGPSPNQRAAKQALISLYKTCFSVDGTSRIAASEIPYRP